MEKNEKAIDDQQAEGVREKRPYKMPELQRLGSLVELTKGVHIVSNPDVGGLSF